MPNPFLPMKCQVVPAGSPDKAVGLMDQFGDALSDIKARASRLVTSCGEQSESRGDFLDAGTRDVVVRIG